MNADHHRIDAAARRRAGIRGAVLPLAACVAALILIAAPSPAAAGSPAADDQYLPADPSGGSPNDDFSFSQASEVQPAGGPGSAASTGDSGLGGSTTATTDGKDAGKHPEGASRGAGTQGSGSDGAVTVPFTDYPLTTPAALLLALIALASLALGGRLLLARGASRRTSGA